MVGIPSEGFVQRLGGSHLLVQAQKAAQYGDWGLVTQLLHQFVQADAAAVAPEAPDYSWRVLLELALATLMDGDFQDRWEVARLIASLSAIAPHKLDSVVSQLIALMQNSQTDPEVRWFAARILGEFRQPNVLSALIDLLKTSQQPDLSDMAATALAGFGSAAVAALNHLLPIPELRLVVVKILSQIRTPETVSPLMQLAHDEDSAIRAMAIAALGSFHHPAIVPILVQALQDPAPAVRQAAVTDLSFRLDLTLEVDTVRLIQPLLSDPHPQVCQQAAIALGRLATEAAANALAQRLREPEVAIALQVEIARVLGWINTPVAHRHLQQALFSPISLEVMREILIALGRAKSPESQSEIAEILVTLLQSGQPMVQHPDVKQTIALQLGQLKSPLAMEALLQLATDADLGVKLHAIAALKNLAPDIAHQRLEIMQNDLNLTETLRQEAAIALQEWR